MSWKSGIGFASAILGLVMLGSVGIAAPASAASRNGSCEDLEFCYYYNSNNAGSVSDFDTSLASYGDTQPTCYEFRGAGAGQHQCIKNNAASVWNQTRATVRVYYNTNYSGVYQDIPAGYKGNLSALYNENASHQVLSVATAAPSTQAEKIAASIKTARAEITLHPLYAWGGGHGTRPGASRGYCDAINGYLNGECVADDRIGFDCSGLMRWAYFKATGLDWGNMSTTHLYSSRPAVFGTTISSVSGLKPGDLVLTKTNTDSSIVNHTAIVSTVSGTIITIIEAPRTDRPLRETTLDQRTFRKAYRLK